MEPQRPSLRRMVEFLAPNHPLTVLAQRGAQKGAMQKDLCFSSIEAEAQFRRRRVAHHRGNLQLNEGVRMAAWFILLVKTWRGHTFEALAGLLASALIFLMPAGTPLG